MSLSRYLTLPILEIAERLVRTYLAPHLFRSRIEIAAYRLYLDPDVREAFDAGAREILARHANGAEADEIRHRHFAACAAARKAAVLRKGAQDEPPPDSVSG